MPDNLVFFQDILQRFFDQQPLLRLHRRVGSERGNGPQFKQHEDTERMGFRFRFGNDFRVFARSPPALLFGLFND